VRVDASLAEILARPLFNPNRRPPEAARQGEASVGELGGERLSGIVVEADRRLAIFAVAGTKPQTLGEGDTVAGWRIENIAPGEVSLSGPGGVQTLRPKSDPNAVRQVRPGPQVKSTEAVSRPDPRTLTAPARPVPAPQPAGTAPGTRPASPNRRRGE
jgi:hypothetical protein